MNCVLPDVIFTRSFPLNASKLKFAIVGMQLFDGKWKPSVNLVSQFWFGITMTSEEWTELLKLFEHIRRYLAGETMHTNPIKISAYCTINFSTAHNQSVIIIEKQGKLFKHWIIHLKYKINLLIIIFLLFQIFITKHRGCSCIKKRTKD